MMHSTNLVGLSLSLYNRKCTKILEGALVVMYTRFHAPFFPRPLGLNITFALVLALHFLSRALGFKTEKRKRKGRTLFSRSFFSLSLLPLFSFPSLSLLSLFSFPSPLCLLSLFSFPSPSLLFPFSLSPSLSHPPQRAPSFSQPRLLLGGHDPQRADCAQNRAHLLLRRS